MTAKARVTGPPAATIRPLEKLAGNKPALPVVLRNKDVRVLWAWLAIFVSRGRGWSGPFKSTTSCSARQLLTLST
ncbi:hypothetical protein MHA02_42840 [Methylobacterium haplocladii]|uniref:Uncharacterized protein n=1 Tax=Methylobacterium haplocladii TaxID=1176176 RepID=A0A512IW05_9HYPH|nr:hypothetical protein MHA02_42840 [Methylobacterium haplocladii]